jgi:FMN phosphatase YigB (HAD superfamily)
MKIIIDFDDVLFNTAEFKKELVRVFVKNNVSGEEFNDSYNACAKSIGRGLVRRDVYAQIVFLEEKLGIDGKKLKKDLDAFLSDTSNFVFSDAEEFFHWFKREDLILFSFGGSEFEKKKIMNSGLVSFFGRIILTGETKSVREIGLVKGEKFIFIDDRTEHIENIKNEMPACATILLKRKEGRYDSPKTKYVDFEAENLTEADGVIKKIKD